jgi:Flp pilus assembly protein TadG
MKQRPSLAGLRNNRRGTSLIEMAIMIPVLLLMCCGTMDFARIMYAGIAIANSARAGVQFGALAPGNSGDMAGMVQATLNDAADLGVSNVTATARNFCACTTGSGEVPCSSNCSGITPSGYVSVTASYTFNPLVPYPGIPQAVVVGRTAKMRVQ